MVVEHQLTAELLAAVVHVTLKPSNVADFERLLSRPVLFRPGELQTAVAVTQQARVKQTVFGERSFDRQTRQSRWKLVFEMEQLSIQHELQIGLRQLSAVQ